MTSYTIAVVQDAVAVLDAFSHVEKGLTLTEVAEKTGLGKNKVFRILHTLAQSRMVYRDSNQRFHLGFRVAELAQHVHQHHLLLDISEPIMQMLLADTQESIFLGIASGHNALCIAALESTRSMRLYARVGIQSPLYMGGVPKVLLANMNAIERESHVRFFEESVDNGNLDWLEFRQKLDGIREQGHSITVDELDLGAQSVTAPIFDSTGQVIAGMSIAGPSIRFAPDLVKRYIGLITDATLGISAAFGYNPSLESESLSDEKIVSNVI